MASVIYKITNLLNSKIYIGKEKQYNSNYLGSGKVLKLAIKKYGKDNFVKEILQECFNGDELNKLEKFWITKLNSTDRNIGYNIAEGGTGGKTLPQPWNKNKKLGPLSKECKDKLSKILKERYKKEQHPCTNRIPWNKGKKILNPPWNKGLTGLITFSMSLETKQKISNALKNKPKTLEHKLKLSRVNIGKKLSDATRNKMSESRKGVPQKKIKCPFCGKEGGTAMHRWHFNNCKLAVNNE